MAKKNSDTILFILLGFYVQNVCLVAIFRQGTHNPFTIDTRRRCFKWPKSYVACGPLILFHNFQKTDHVLKTNDWLWLGVVEPPIECKPAQSVPNV